MFIQNLRYRFFICDLEGEKHENKINHYIQAERPAQSPKRDQNSEPCERKRRSRSKTRQVENSPVAELFRSHKIEQKPRQGIKKVCRQETRESKDEYQKRRYERHRAFEILVHFHYDLSVNTDPRRQLLRNAGLRESSLW